MKYLTRYLSLFLCFLLLFIVFSIPVSAKTVSIKPYNVFGYMLAKWDSGVWQQGVNFTPNDGQTDYFSGLYAGSFTQYNNYKITLQTSYQFTSDDIPFIEPEYNTKITIHNMRFENFVQYDGTNHFFNTPTTSKVLITYEGGTMEYVDCDLYTLSSGSVNKHVEFEFTPKKGITKIEVIMISDATVPNGKSFKIGGVIGESGGDTLYDIEIEQTSEDTGLLKGIIEWLKGIKEGITNLFNSITELPSKLWNLISEGLKNLFVPTESNLTTFKDNMQNLLSEKLGAVYQVLDITFNSWDRIQANDEQNSITFPKATIEVGNENEGSVPFSLGGNNVKIVPEGFEWLATSIKTFIGIICTVLFVNGLRKRYDEIMG